VRDDQRVSASALRYDAWWHAGIGRSGKVGEHTDVGKEVESVDHFAAGELLIDDT
jgi:hypothetical protein